ncbi:hypothetical protein [Kribbella rubisoli]|nr:hypothetical protein [Kribbella rubisoli]
MGFAARRLGEGFSGRLDAVDSWLHNEFQSLMSDGRVPVMRSFRGGCDAPTGFRAFYSTESMTPAHIEEYEAARDELLEQFIRQIKRDQPAIEVRIQMRFPEVYAEIDRLKVEAELRMSIFWPLLILSGVLATAWSPIALALLVAPPFLLRDGFKRMREASEKTWGALMAREVSSPTLDAMDSAKREKCLSFAGAFGEPDPPAVMAADQRPIADLSGLST